MIMLWFFLGLMLLTALLFALMPLLSRKNYLALDLRKEAKYADKTHHLINSLTFVFILFFIPLLAISFYLKWGASNLLAQNYSLQKNKDILVKQLSELSTLQLIERMKKILVTHPNDARGLFLLGRLYQNQNDDVNALKAFNKAHQLSPNNSGISLQLAELLFFMNNRQLNDQAKQLIAQVLTVDSKNPRAINLLAINAYKNKDFRQAINYWEKLLPLFSPQSAEGQAILQAIHQAQQKE